MLVCWRRIVAAWAMALVLIVAGLAATESTHSIGEAEATPTAVRGVKIPQHDPFDLGPPAFSDDDLSNFVGADD